MLPKDYVRLRLCGEFATDVTDASGTLWFDVAARSWSDRVLDELEVDRSWLPRVEESVAVTGSTPGGVPVAAGAGDQAAGALGVGADRPGPVSVVLGTSGVVLSALPSYAADPGGRLQASCHAAPDRWFAMGVILVRGRVAALAARRDRPRVVRRAARGGGAVAARAPRASPSCPTWPASARRTPTRTRAAPSPA